MADPPTRTDPISTVPSLRAAWAFPWASTFFPSRPVPWTASIASSALSRDDRPANANMSRPGAVLAQIKAALSSGRRIDAITFSGSGEPP